MSIDDSGKSLQCSSLPRGSIVSIEDYGKSLQCSSLPRGSIVSIEDSGKPRGLPTLYETSNFNPGEKDANNNAANEGGYDE